jgi:hypothetical protein
MSPRGEHGGGAPGGHGGEAQSGDEGHGGGGEQVRFRVVAAFATATSTPVTIEDDGAGSLLNPQWSHEASYHHGEEAAVRVDAPGLDGRRVRFNIEQQRGSDWVRYASATAHVRNGIATAAVRVHHPAAAAAQGERAHQPAGPAQLRFHAELL